MSEGMSRHGSGRRCLRIDCNHLAAIRVGSRWCPLRVITSESVVGLPRSFASRICVRKAPLTAGAGELGRFESGVVGVDRGNDHGALAHGRCDAFDGAGAYVADCEQAGFRGGIAVAGDDEALVIELNTCVQQRGGARLRADE
jgi:hypothetical protein